MIVQRILLALLVGHLLCCSSVAQEPAAGAVDSAQVKSPGGKLAAAVRLDAIGRPAIEIRSGGEIIALVSLGLEFAEGGVLQRGLRVVATDSNHRNETYSIPVGKASTGKDHHNELVVSFEESSPPHRKLDVVVRAFDEGIAFRYVVPKQDDLDAFRLTDELTSFTFSRDPEVHFLPLGGYTTPYESRYQTKRLSELEPPALVGLPLVMLDRSADGSPVCVAISEAGLTDYAGMYVSRHAGEPDTLVARLSPLPGRDDRVKVIGRAPHESPWRVLMVADELGRLIESQLVFHLSEPPKVADTSWIKPGKTTFPWWNGYVLPDVDFEPGLNTATYKHYIDFCAEHGIPYHSLDGTDTAWYGGPIVPSGPVDITTAVPEIDLPELLRYADEKGVRLRLWMHWKPLSQQIDQALPVYEKWGIEGIMVDFMDRDDQEMVKFYHQVAEKAARHKLTVTFHGAYKPTGMERTWPNVLTYEAVFNQEYNKWDPIGTPPEHNLDVALVRMLAGPLDYHQGGMRNVLPADFQPQDKSPRVQGTRGHQLAMYVVYQNHLPMMVDYPAAYRGTDGLEFLVAVPCNWDETRALKADFGKCVAIARRKGGEWWVGAMTAGEPQSLHLPLEFLEEGRFQAQILTDDPTAGPTSLQRREQVVSAQDSLEIEIPAGGGAVIQLTPIDE